MKIGVITHYYNSTNYGGNLQAFALTKIIQGLGHDCMQISYDILKNAPSKNSDKIMLVRIVKKVLSACKLLYFPNLQSRIMSGKMAEIKRAKRKAFASFQSIIPHTQNIYDIVTIKNYSEEFDVVVTGSDQVWNLTQYISAYFLNFVKANVKKISYAASIAMDNLSQEQKVIFKQHIADFKAISVREKSDIDLIKDISPTMPVMTLDPTFLLDVKEWNKVADDRMIKEKYVFCYFIGDNAQARRVAQKYAIQHSISIVNVQYMNGFKRADVHFGDYKLQVVSPEQWLSLIKYSEYVFTDSFHAVVFSYIFQKDFFVFNRSKAAEMSSRIYNITNLIECPERYCDTKDKENIKYINSLSKIDYTREFKELNKLREFSINFLKDNLGE